MTPWTVARQAPLSMDFFRQGFWSGLPFPSPGDLPDPGTEPGSHALQLTCNVGELGFIPGLGRSPGEFRGLYSPWGLKELDTTEQLSHTQSCIVSRFFTS